MGCFDQYIRIFEHGREVSSTKHEMFVPAVRYDAKGKRLLTGAGDGSARI